MVIFVGAGRIKPEEMDKVQAAIQKFMPTVEAEEGTLEYVIYQGVEDSNVLFFVENYQDEAARQAHWASAEFQEFAQVMQGAVAGQPMMGPAKVIASVKR